MRYDLSGQNIPVRVIKNLAVFTQLEYIRLIVYSTTTISSPFLTSIGWPMVILSRLEAASQFLDGAKALRDAGDYAGVISRCYYARAGRCWGKTRKTVKMAMILHPSRRLQHSPRPVRTPLAVM